jgi:acetyl-CoA carboxylase biotin carboxyl carrier protein
MIKKKPGAKGTAGAASSAASDPLLTRVRELAQIATEFDLAEVELDADGDEVKIRLSRRMVALASAPVAYAAPAASAAPASGKPAAAAESAEAGDSVFVASPFVGTFYRSPSPDASAFVEVGAAVRKGQVVCIIEAMKLMNEIESEVEGKVVEVMAKNGEHVEYGQKLFRLSPA